VTAPSLALDDIPTLFARLRARLVDAPEWDSVLERVLSPETPERAHLAVMHEPYLSHVLNGRKRIESRFSRHRVAPFDQVGVGDVLLLKAHSGPVTGVARVAHVDSYVLDPASLTSIRGRFSTALCAEDDGFWAERCEARYATLMLLSNAVPIEPLSLDKRDRRPWVILVPPTRAEVHRNQLSLVPDDPSKRRPTPNRIVIRYETRGHDASTQLSLLE
jgi:hypothetical protein